MGEIKCEEEEPFDRSFFDKFKAKMDDQKAKGIGIWAKPVTESDKIYVECQGGLNGIEFKIRILK